MRNPQSHSALRNPLLLACLGGTLGVLLAFGLRDLRPAMLGDGREPLDLQVPVDGRVLAFSAVVCLCTGVFCGLLAALRAVRAAALDPMAALRCA